MKTQNQVAEIETSYLVFAKRVLADLTVWRNTREVARHTETKLAFTDDGIAEDRHEYITYWPIISDHYGDALWGTQEAEHTAQLHLLNGVIEPPKLSDAQGRPIVAPTFEQMRSWIVLDLLRPLMALIERHSTLDVSDDQILESYRSARALWTAKEFEHYLLVPLSRLTGDIDHLELQPDLTLSPFLPSEKTSTWAMMGMLPFGGPSVWEFQETRYKILHNAVLPRGRRADENAVQRDVRHFVSALRLFKPGQVGTLGVFAGTVGGSATSYGWTTPDLQVQKAGQDYNLSRTESATVLALFRRLRDGFIDKSLRSLDVAIRRFNLSYARTLPEDRIIDLTVALESTLLHGIDTELQYRLSIRGAALLSQEFSPADVRAELTGIYDVRSAIVHNGASVEEALKRRTSRFMNPPITSVDDLVSRTEAMVRSVIRQYVGELSTSRSLSDVNLALEKTITDRLAC
jgi:hypothetical protein